MNNKPTDPNNSNKDPNNNSPSPFFNKNAQRLWIVLGVVVLLMFIVIFGQPNNTPRSSTISVDQLATQIEQGNVQTITVRGSTDVFVELDNGTTVYLYKSPESDLFQQLATYGVTDEQIQAVALTEQQGDNTTNLLFQIMIGVIPTILIVWLLWRMMRSVRTGQDQAMSFGRSRARVVRDMERPQVTFGDVAGADEAKQELAEVVEFLKEPEKFIRLGARIPKGVLMVGPPGTGKTLMARAVAGEAGVPFFSISGSEFVEMFVGVGASRVRDLFERAKAEAPAIVFVDEIDAVGRHRGAGLGGGHDEREQTLNQILVEMDGFETGTNVIIIAATNRPDILDPALLRPGRFDRKVMMDNPDIKGRIDILKVHSKGKPLAADVDMDTIARITPGFSGADLENLINESAILAARRNKKSIGMSEIQEAMERVVMGPERKTRVMSESDKRKVAFHEAGHAVVQYYRENSNPVHKITIIPRGRAGGFVMSLPDEDVFLRSREQFEDEIAGMMGGRAAEEIVYGQFTTGASSDIQAATARARMMVTQFGMSETLGPRSFGGASGSLFLGRDLYEQRDYSEQAAEDIDNEVKRILQTGYQRAKATLTEHRDKLDHLATLLIEVETLDRTQFEALMSGQEVLDLPVLNLEPKSTLPGIELPGDTIAPPPAPSVPPAAASASGAS
ncbi:MAG TPA: ATP-dependent zinc metalloprotease FtsH [Candidatus Limnocylindrales bacterium]|nr:ATP-dependent zinc metalloprotease FtsH [Candidatus Limnocylindrales bacterium]